MSLQVIITRDYDHMSEVAAHVCAGEIRRILASKDGCSIGLPAGASPRGLYRHLARAANDGTFAGSRVTSVNLDEYVGLPGDTAVQRMLHPRSFSFFMIEAFFGHLDGKFSETHIPAAALIDPARLEEALDRYPSDWHEKGSGTGRAIVIDPTARSPYLRWVRREVIDAYGACLERIGGADLQVIGVGTGGHVGFHESGIPFEDSRVLLVKLDERTLEEWAAGSPAFSEEESPRFAVTMGAQSIFSASMVLLIASGRKKSRPVFRALLEEPTADVPLSYCQRYTAGEGTMICILDRDAAGEIIREEKTLQDRSVEVRDLSSGRARAKAADLRF